MSKSLEDYFIDWEASAFGYGYGTGEEHCLKALRQALDLMPSKGCYDYRTLEDALTPAVAWLLINVLCRENIIEYGTSTRYGWLTPEGLRLKEFIMSKSDDELYDLVCKDGEDRIICYQNACNCGPNGYQEGVKCANPFWRGR